MQKLSAGPAQSAAPATLTPARLSLAAAAASLLFLAALHVLSPEFDPSWRMVSEYALGRYGWILALMFLSMSLSAVALFFAIKPTVRTLGGKIGLGFLLATALGMALAAVFDFSHNLHGLAALIGIPTFPIAAMLTSLSLRGRQPWSAARPWLVLTANLTWISFVLMFAAVFIGLSQTGGEFGPGVLIGLPNRLLLVSNGAWLMVAARTAARLPALDV